MPQLDHNQENTLRSMLLQFVNYSINESPVLGAKFDSRIILYHSGNAYITFNEAFLGATIYILGHSLGASIELAKQLIKDAARSMDLSSHQDIVKILAGIDEIEASMLNRLAKDSRVEKTENTKQNSAESSVLTQLLESMQQLRLEVEELKQEVKNLRQTQKAPAEGSSATPFFSQGKNRT